MAKSTTYNIVRGTHDLIGEDYRRFAYITETARRIVNLYGFDEWSTPIFEDTRVFSRSLGDTSDIVSKEMYTFEDQSGESLTLRPEGTAAIARALITNGLTQSLPQKVFYSGPMFRRERPQKGRYRQFHQIGSELLGAAEPQADAEMITMARDLLLALEIENETVLELNTLGDTASRDAWRTALIAHFSAHRADLSADSQARLERNPLRILDSKDENDRRLVADAPTITGFLTPEALKFWDDLRKNLDIMKVPFRENPHIVRGLDYYGHTTFEFVTNRLGAQGTVLAGGRYDDLVAEMGGPKTPAIGWAAGVERLSMLLGKSPAAPRSIVVVPMGEEAYTAGISIIQTLRNAGIRVETSFRGNMKRRLERANKINATHVIIIGSDEITRGIVQVKNMDNGKQTEVCIADIITFLRT